MTLLELLVLALGIYFGARLLIFVYKRTRFLIKILSLNKLDGSEVEIENILRFYSPRVTKKPICRVRVYSKWYAVRAFSGKGNFYAAHIVNERFAALFMKTGGAVKVRAIGRRFAKAVTEGSRVYFPKTVHLPALPENSDDIPALIFNPAPRDLTYVTPERTSIKVAFTGDEVYGHKIFTASTFVNYIDRDTRGFYDNIKTDIYDFYR